MCVPPPELLDLLALLFLEVVELLFALGVACVVLLDGTFPTCPGEEEGAEELLTPGGAGLPPGLRKESIRKSIRLTYCLVLGS